MFIAPVTAEVFSSGGGKIPLIKPNISLLQSLRLFHHWFYKHLVPTGLKPDDRTVSFVRCEDFRDADLMLEVIRDVRHHHSLFE